MPHASLTKIGAFAVLTLASWCPRLAAQRTQNGSGLDRTIAAPDLKRAPVYVAQSIFMAAGITSGGIASSYPNCHPPQVGSAKPLGRSTARAWLNELVRINPTMGWNDERGVVDVLPRRLPPVLQVKIDRFDAAERRTRTPQRDAIRLVQQLFQSPAVVNYFRTHLKSPAASVASGPEITPPLAEPRSIPAIHLQNVTVLEALNAIARAYRHVWWYSEAHCDDSVGVNFS